MCGVAGFLSSSAKDNSSAVLKRMTNALIHRGPDAEGAYFDGGLSLGHRRLSIIDLSEAGNQPMLTKDGRYAFACNGEIYNYRELRKELVALGHEFSSQSDSEVAFKAIIEWGKDALLKFNGMFAFAFWDKSERRLLLARDRYGIKPIYYYQRGDTVIFASEMKAIQTHPEFVKELDKQGVYEYFTFQNFFTEKTLFAGVNLLPAGTFLEISERGSKQVTPERYWDYNFVEPDGKIDEREYLEELDRLFRQAVQRQLVSDVDIGAYLSGGMDSGAISAVASQSVPYMKSFTCGFDLNSASGLELNFDERATAEYMSYLFKTEHYEMVLKAGDMVRVMPKLVKHLEEPRVGQSYPNYYAAKLASKFVKVVLSGAGGDELFGGYPWRYYRAVVNTDFDHYVDKYYSFWQRLIPNTLLKKVFSPIAHEVEGVWTRDIFARVFSSHANELTRPEDYVNHSLYFEAKTFLHGLLVVEDKLSMAHSLESRVPFLDNDLVDFAMKLPVRLKLGKLDEVVRLNENDVGDKTEKYFEKANDGKLLLRRAMSRYLPQKIVAREKQGFSAPDASWFKGESIEYVRMKLMHSDARIYEFMDKKTIQNLLDLHLSGKENKRLLVWSLLYFEEWCQQQIL